MIINRSRTITRNMNLKMVGMMENLVVRLVFHRIRETDIE